jgi:hypothetical protein
MLGGAPLAQATDGPTPSPTNTGGYQSASGDVEFADAKCDVESQIPNSVIVTLGEGTTATYQRDESEPEPIDAGLYGPEFATPGDYLFILTGEDGSTLEFEHTFVAPDPECVGLPVEYYEVGLYLYQKKDPSKPASWQNSGLQNFIAAKPGTEWFTEFPGDLPEGVCGDGWAVQQDKVRSEFETFPWPATIKYPVDNIGWPPIYDARHDNLHRLIEIPECGPGDTEVIPAEPSGSVATCGVEEGEQSGSVTVGFETGIAYAIYGVGNLEGYIVDPVVGSVTDGLPVGEYQVFAFPEEGYTIGGPDIWPVTVQILPNETCGELPDFAVIPTSATVTPPRCSTEDGSITVGQVDGQSFFDGVTYSIDGTVVTSPTTSAEPGSYQVTVVPHQGNTLDGPAQFDLVVPESTVSCGDLTTLALTGTETRPWMAGGLALLGLGLLVVAVPVLLRTRKNSAA